PEVEKIVATAKENFDKEMSQVVLKDNKITLNGERENVRSRETNLGNLVGDSLMAYGNNGGFKNHSDFAMMNGGGIRTTIKPGNVTKGDIVGVMPFGNTVSQIKVTGNEIYAMFEHSLRSIHKKDEAGNVIIDKNGVPELGANGGFLQVSDTIKVIYDSNLQGEDTETHTPGKRVTKIEIKDKAGKFIEVPRKDDVTYNMVTNDFLAAGGDGYEMLKGKPVEQGPSMDEVFMKYLSDEKLDLNTYAEEIPYSRIIGQATKVLPQGPAIEDGRYVQVVKKGYSLWSNFGWKERNTSNNVLNEIFTSKYKYNHENGATYLSLYDSKGKWQGYINENATKEAKNLQGDYIKYGKYVTINRTGYSTWSNFDWKERNQTENLLGETYQARGKYKHANGATYLSLYDSKGKWHGYVNKNAVKVGEGRQGAYIADGSYVTISKGNYDVWSNFNWKKRHSSKKVLNETFQAKGHYKHINGATYYSLYDNKGKWHGYINANAVKVGEGKQGAYISYGKKVTIAKKGYSTWSNFSWKERNTTDKMMKEKFTAKGQYNHFNGSTYYSLYDNDGKWHGYVNKNAVK
ncbi:MAG: 5'-nucleotidase, partial [Vagococcus sp.]